MASERKTLRLDLLTRLKASSAITAIVPAARIYDSRMTALPVGMLPAINVFVVSTTEKVKGASPILFSVSHTAIVECFETGASDQALAASLDDLEETVKTELMNDGDFLSQYEFVTGIETQIALESSGDERKGLARMVFDVDHSMQYDPKAADPATADDLSSISIDVDFIEDGDAPDGDIDAELDLTNLEV
jgi:hypothetical protein